MACVFNFTSFFPHSDLLYGRNWWTSAFWPNLAPSMFINKALPLHGAVVYLNRSVGDFFSIDAMFHERDFEGKIMESWEHWSWLLHWCTCSFMGYRQSVETLGFRASLKEVNQWRCAFQEVILSPGSLFSFFCFLAIMSRADLFHCTHATYVFLPYHRLRINTTNWSWAEISWNCETQWTFPALNWFSQYFVTIVEIWLIDIV